MTQRPCSVCAAHPRLPERLLGRFRQDIHPGSGPPQRAAAHLGDVAADRSHAAGLTGLTVDQLVWRARSARSFFFPLPPSGARQSSAAPVAGQFELICRQSDSNFQRSRALYIARKAATRCRFAGDRCGCENMQVRPCRATPPLADAMNPFWCTALQVLRPRVHRSRRTCQLAQGPESGPSMA